MSAAYATGLNLPFFNVNKPIENQDDSDIIARNALRVLMMGWWDDESWLGLKSWRVFNAVFINRDPVLLRGMRRAFQDGFDDIYAELNQLNLEGKQLKQAEFFLSNCMSLLPFADISAHQSFRIPQYIDKHWVMVDYKVVPIELTPTSGVEKLFIHDRDRVFAYGLEPIDNPDAEPHLIFMGTTYPAGQGFMTQVCSDLECDTPGASLYRTGRDKITDWLDQQPKKTHVCGMSLGGSLSLLLALDQGEKLSRVDALNPPGLYEPWLKNPFDKWDNCPEQPPVYIQKQGRDPVSYFGLWKSEWNIFHVIPPQDKQGPNALTDHALNYAGFEATEFVIIDTDIDNQERKNRNFWVYTVGRSIVYWLFIVPFRYLVLPVLRYAWDHKIAITLLIALTVSLPFLPSIAATIICGALVLSAAIYLLYKLISMVTIVLGYNTVNEPRCHDQKLFQGNEEDDNDVDPDVDDVDPDVGKEELGLRV